MNSSSRHSARPVARFHWQAAFILGPVIALTALGLWSLRQDRLLAEQDARARAGRLAQAIADRAMVALCELDPLAATPGTPPPDLDPDRPWFELEPSLAPVWPPPFEPLPVPSAFDLTRLPADARAAWDAAHEATRRGDDAAATTHWDQVLATQPPGRLGAHALLESAEALGRTGAADAALARLRRVVAEHPTAVGESGLPLAPLAQWRLAELELRAATNLERRARLLDAAGSNLVHRPTTLTPWLLQRLERGTAPDALSHPSTSAPDAGPSGGGHADDGRAIAPWLRRWETTEIARRLAAAAQARWRAGGWIVTNIAGEGELRVASDLAPLWVRLSPAGASASEAPGEAGERLLTQFPPGRLRFVARTEGDVTQAVAQACAALPEFPAYFSATVTIGGRTLPAWRGGTLLAERAARHSARPGTAEPVLRASVYLADAAALYAQQRQRTWWVLALILAAAATAGMGLLSAQRTFQRQRLLTEMKSNFVSSVSHELRAPIASVRLLAESLERGTVREEPRRLEYFRLIAQECRRLSGLIENVLDFSRIDQGRKRYELEPTDLVALVRQTAQVLEPYAAERQVRLQTELPSVGVTAQADGRALQQALVNLIDNAIKHSPAGEVVRVILAADPSAPGAPAGATGATGRPGAATGAPLAPSMNGPSPSVRLIVQDRGPGIPPEDCERIFEPFYRRGSELRRETTGVGIGLSLVKHTVEAHGGAVWVGRDAGPGSRFIVELPATCATSRALPDASPADAAPIA